MLAKRLQAEEEEKRRLEDEHRRLTAESLRRAEDERQTLLELERANAHLREVEQVHDQSVVTLEVPTLNGNYNNKGDNNNKPLPPITMESPRSKRSQSVTEYDVAKESPTLSEEEIFKQMVSQQQ